MERDYGCAGQALPSNPQTTQSEDRFLDHLAGHANAAHRIGDLLEQFLSRFHGGGPATDPGAGGPEPSGHAYQFARLDAALARAEELARALSSIG